jgi:hypothetical protein
MGMHEYYVCIYTHVPVVFSTWASSTESFCRIKVDAGTKFELNLLSSDSSVCLVTFTDGGPSTGITYKQGVNTNSSTEPVQIQIADLLLLFPIKNNHKNNYARLNIQPDVRKIDIIILSFISVFQG